MSKLMPVAAGLLAASALGLVLVARADAAENTRTPVATGEGCVRLAFGICYQPRANE